MRQGFYNKVEHLILLELVMKNRTSTYRSNRIWSTRSVHSESRNTKYLDSNLYGTSPEIALHASDADFH